MYRLSASPLSLRVLALLFPAVMQCIASNGKAASHLVLLVAKVGHGLQLIKHTKTNRNRKLIMETGRVWDMMDRETN
jgi:hypothetical protein